MDEKIFSNMFGSFRALTRAYNDYITTALSEFELTPNEVTVIAALKNFSSASKIAEVAGVSKALVSRSVKLLKEKGFIVVTISPRDKREQEIKLTDDGVELLKKVDELNASFCDVIFKGTDARVLEVTGLALKVMVKNINSVENGVNGQ